LKRFKSVSFQIFHFFLFPLFLGIFGGLSAVFFRKLISWSSDFKLFLSGYWGKNFFLIIPLIFLLTYFVGSKLLVSPQNVTIDEIAKRIALERGGFNIRKAFLVLGFTSFNIGMGLPVGREGPIAKLGGVISELFSKLFKVDKVHLPIYLTCGVVSALSATFNAPVAAVLFGAEVILGKLSSYFLIPLLVSSATGTLVARHFLGDFRAFSLPHLSYSNSMLPYFPLVSLVSAVTVLFFTTSLKFLERLRFLLKEIWLLPVLIFSLLTTFLLYFFPQAQGVGYRDLTLLFYNKYL
jgi:CIC family chloride channel protein